VQKPGKYRARDCIRKNSLESFAVLAHVLEFFRELNGTASPRVLGQAWNRFQAMVRLMNKVRSIA
jgi:hypothetical protein